VTLPGRLYATVIVTASGGVFDGYGSPYGFKIAFRQECDRF